MIVTTLVTRTIVGTGGSRVVIAKDGIANAPSAVQFDGSGGELLNLGLIDGRVLFDRVSVDLAPSSVTNHGVIASTFAAAVMTRGADTGTRDLGFRLLNTGLIDGYVSLGSPYSFVVNSGTIYSTGNTAIDVSNGSNARNIGATIQNSGLIAVANQDLAIPGVRDPVYLSLLLSNLNDRVVNSGRIIGDISLGEGNDTFDGRGGTVDGRILGGAGNDTFIVDDPAAVIVEANRQGNDTVQAWVDFITPQHVETLQLMGPAIRGTGNGQANRIVGNAQDNVLAGLGGNDQLFGDLGDDTIAGGAGNDRVFGGEGNDVAWGGAGNDTLLGQDGDDALRGDAGNDSLDGAAGNDSLWGGAGNDRAFGGADDDALWGAAGNDALDGGEGDDSIWGGIGDDTLFGLTGEDAIFGGAGRDSIDGGADDDSLYGGGGFDTILGGDGDDLIEGGGGNDDLRGGLGADTIRGGTGDDIIEGGLGPDLLDGGPGADRFVFRQVEDSGGPGIDTILGFQPGEDVIDLRLIDANTNVAGRQAFTLIFAAPFSGAAGELRVEILPGQRLVLGDTDGDRVADFALALDGTPILAGSSFLL